MKIKKLCAEGFGCLKNWESPEIDADCIIFIGPNESGKSTIFNLISSLFYGFSPASKMDNPYSPWDGTNASCSGEFVYDDGTAFSVYRTLKSRADGKIICKSSSTSLGNKPIEKLDVLPRNIFMEAYALTVDELCFPDDKLWQKIEDQLLGGQYSSFLRPVRDVIPEVEGEAANLWRPDRRGNPKDRQLKDQLSGLKERLRGAAENEKRLYELRGELSDLGIMLDNKLKRKTFLSAYIERFQRLSPVRKKMELIKQLKMNCQGVDLFGSIPDNADEVLDEFDKRIDYMASMQKDLIEQQKKLEYQAGLFTQKDRKVYEQANAIKDVVRSYSQISMDLQSAFDADEEIRNIRGRLLERAGDFINGGWKDEYEGAIYRIDEAGLRVSMDKFNRLKSQEEEQKYRVQALKSKSRNKIPFALPLISVLLILSGLVSLFLSGFKRESLFSIPSIAAGILLYIFCLTLKGGKNSSEIKEASMQLKDLKDKKDAVLSSIGKCFADMPVSDIVLQNPDEGLIISVNRLKDTVKLLKDAMQGKDRINKRLFDQNKKISQLMVLLDEVPGDDILKNINYLEGLLNNAVEHQNLYIKSHEKLEEIKSSLCRYSGEIKKINDDKNSLIDKINRIDGDNIGNKLYNLKEMRKQYNDAAAIEAGLKREYPDLEQIVGEIKNDEEKNESWTSSDEKMASAQTEKEQLEVELNNINEKLGSVKEGLEHTEGLDRLDDLKGEIMAVEEEIKEIRVKRDRIELLKNILIEADRQYREENQPDILKKAGRYLSLITGARYTSLMMDDSGAGLIVRREDGSIVDLSRALSRGTKEQIYLSLRLALVEHLDVAGEHIPIFLDEAFVNWDGCRSDNFINMLQDIASLRQVFIFTCHDSFAEKFKSLSGVQTVNLNAIP